MKLKITFLTMVLLLTFGLSNLFAQWNIANALPHDHQYNNLLAYEHPVIFNAPQFICEPNGGYSVRVPYNHFDACRTICMVVQPLDSEPTWQNVTIGNCSSSGYLQSDRVNVSGGKDYQISFSDRCPDPHHPLPIFDQFGHQLYPPQPEPAPEYPDTSFIIRVPFCPKPFGDHYLELIAIQQVVGPGEVMIDNPHHQPAKQSTPFATDDVHGEDLTIFPNPATHQISLRFAGGDETNAEVKIYDLLGKAQTVTVQESTDNEVELNISTLPSGTYFLQLTTSHGNVSTKRFQKHE